MGKSTVALEVARQAKRMDIQVFWVDATTRLSVEAGMQQVAAVLLKSDSKAPAHTLGVDEVWNVLDESSRRWLLVFDNADDPQVLAAEGHVVAAGNGWLRASVRGVVMVTSRVAEPTVWGAECSALPIRPLDPDEGARLLLDLVTPPDRTWTENRDEARALAGRMSGLPLALRTAGRFVESSVRHGGPARSFADYSTRLDEGFATLIDAGTQQRYRLEGRDPDPRELVMATWELSLAFLRDQGFPEARALLGIITIFGGAAVPLALVARVAEVASAGPRRLRAALNDLVGFGNRLTTPGEALPELVAAATNLGLAEVTLADGVAPGTEWATLIGVHPLVAEVVQARLAAEEQLKAVLEDLAVRAVTSALRACTPEEPSTWWKAMRLRPHVDALARALIEGRARVDLGLVCPMARAVAAAASNLTRVLPPRPALASLLLYRDLASAALGPRAAPTRRIMQNVGSRMWELGRHDDAANALRESLPASLRLQWAVFPKLALDIKLRVNGLLRFEDHTAGPSFLDDVWVAKILLTMFRRTEHRQNLAETLITAGHFTEAEAALNTLLPELVKRQGTDHHNVLRARHSLATIALNTKRPVEATRIFRTIWEVRLRTLGEDHPDTLTARVNLASALHRQGRYVEAEQVIRTALVACRKVLGEEHPDTLTAQNHLASTLYEQGRYVEAEQEYRTALVARRKVLGEEHPDTLTSRHNLANCLVDQDRLAEAEQERRLVVTGHRSVLGEEHPDTLTARVNLASALHRQGRYVEAEQEIRTALVARRKVLGEEHPDTLTAQNNLASTLHELGRYVEAEQERGCPGTRGT